MGRILKYILFILIGIVVLTAIGMGILIYTFNPNELKAPITQQVKAMTGRNIVIEGNIGWKLFPWLGVSIQNVELSNAPKFDQAVPFLKLKEADVSLKVLPLLTGNIEFGKIKLDGLSLNLNTNQKEQNNWSGLFKSKKGKTNLGENSQDKTTNTEIKKSKFNLKPMDLSISSIDISNANISYDDQSKNQKYELRNFSLTSQNISFDSAFPITMDFAFNSSQPNLYGQVSLNTKIAINQGQQTVSVSPFVLDVKVNGPELPKSGLTFNLQSSAALDQKQETLTISKLAGQIANMHFSGKINGIDIFKNPTFNGSLAFKQFNPSLFLKDLTLPAPDLENPNAFTSIALNTTFIVTPEAVSINNLKLNLDQSTLTGHAYIAMSNKNQSQFDLNINTINASNYLPKTTRSNPAKDATKADEKTETPTQPTELIPTEKVRQLNLTGKLNIQKLQYRKLKASNIKLNILANNGIVKMINNSANLYQGQWLSNLALNTQASIPVIQINEAINHVQISELLQAVSDNKKLQVKGTANIKAKLTTQGNTADVLTKNLNGTGQFSLTNGVVKGVNIGYQLDRALALVNRTAIPAQPANDETPFGSLTGTLQIANGVINNNDLLLQSKTMKVTGKGYASLVNQKLNYELDASAEQNGVDPQIYALQQKIGGSIPIKMSGTFESYKVYPNIEVILKNLATSYLKENSDKIKEKVNENLKNLGDKLQKGLKGLFN